MIKVGDIVFQKRNGGQVKNQTLSSRLGLVIEEHKEKGVWPQYRVQFNLEDPKWYYQHDLIKIKWGNKGVEND
jgi:hypothetical protein